MSGCNAESCRTIKAFVESPVTDKSNVSVFEEANDLNAM
jgi:hypothetical protein